jgi:hypothetical protein
MTKSEVLAQVREIQPGEYSDQRLLDMIDECDQRVLREVLDGYLIPQSGGELVVPPPYDGLYKWWVLANICLLQQDVAGYNNFMQLFNALWEEYGRMVSRTYRRERPSVYRL